MPNRTSVARGTLLGITAQAWQMATAFILYHYLSKQLGPHGFGTWRVTLSVLNYFEVLVYTGVVQVASKHLAEDPSRRPVIERGAWLAQGVLAATLFALLELFAGVIAGALNTPNLEPLIRIAALDLPFVAIMMLASNLRLGQHHFTRQAASMMVYSTTKFLAICFLVWRGLSVPGALMGNVVASIVGFGVMFMPWKKAAVKVSDAAAEAKGMGIKGVPFFVQSLMSGVNTESPLWFVQAFTGSATAGLYSSATVLAEIPDFLFAGLNRVLFPSIARAGAENDEPLVARYVTQGVRLALLVTVLGVAVIAATGRQALTFVYTPAFAAAAPTLTILMFAAVGHNIRSTCSEVMMARGQRKEALGIVGVLTVIQVVALAIVTPIYGRVGAACVAAAGALVGGGVSVWILRSLVGRRVLWTLARASVSAAAVGIALRFVQPAGLWLIPAYTAGAALYALLLFATREIDDDDKTSISNVLRRKAATS